MERKEIQQNKKYASVAAVEDESNSNKQKSIPDRAPRKSMNSNPNVIIAYIGLGNIISSPRRHVNKSS